MAQNIYDDEAFFAAYSKLARSEQGLDGAPEWPALRAMLPDLAGKRVLDLGCGFGWFCRWAARQGVTRITGVDISERMLARARSSTDEPSITYLNADLETLELAPGSIDLAYSSLAFHYVENLGALFERLQAALAPGGVLVFSVEHPMFTAPLSPGWSKDGGGRDVWPVSSYLDEGARTTNWLAPGVIKQHRTIQTYVSLNE